MRKLQITDEMLGEMKRLKKESGKTCQDIAAEAFVSSSTVQRYMSGAVKEADTGSFNRIMTAIGGADDPLQPAPQAADTAPDEISQQHYCQLIAAHKAELDRMQGFYIRTIRYKNRWIRFLASLLLLLFALLVIVLLIDIVNPNIGWFRHLFGASNQLPVSRTFCSGR
jgi:hypothetical protein